LALTPFSREEYTLSYQPTDDLVEKARRTVVRAYMGRGTNAATGVINGEGKQSTGFRANSDRAGKTVSRVWMGYSDALEAIIERLQGVVIEKRNALEIIGQHDTPYLFSTRDDGEDYRNEMKDEDHIKLAELLNVAKGVAIVSGYDSDLYNKLYKGWMRQYRVDQTDSHERKTEVLWMKGIELDLFSGVGDNDV
jgi:DNA adenine methylase